MWQRNIPMTSLKFFSQQPPVITATPNRQCLLEAAAWKNRGHIKRSSQGTGHAGTPVTSGAKLHSVPKLDDASHRVDPQKQSGKTSLAPAFTIHCLVSNVGC